jgi:hypothetical protein
MIGVARHGFLSVAIWERRIPGGRGALAAEWSIVAAKTWQQRPGKLFSLHQFAMMNVVKAVASAGRRHCLFFG